MVSAVSWVIFYLGFYQDVEWAIGVTKVLQWTNVGLVGFSLCRLEDYLEAVLVMDFNPFIFLYLFVSCFFAWFWFSNGFIFFGLTSVFSIITHLFRIGVKLNEV